MAAESSGARWPREPWRDLRCLVRARALSVNETLDAFFAPFNERLYRWASARNIDFGRWDNATSSRLDVS